MKWKIVFGALVLSVTVCSQSYGFDLLNRMLGVQRGGCNSCCEPSCCEQSSCEPSCCDTCDDCCDTCDSCCKKSCPLFDGLKGMFDRKSCCNSCEPSCCDTCDDGCDTCDDGCDTCDTCDSCDSCCKKSYPLLDGLKDMLRVKTCCKKVSSCNDCCEPSCCDTCDSCDSCGPKCHTECYTTIKIRRPLLGLLKDMFPKKCCKKSSCNSCNSCGGGSYDGGDDAPAAADGDDAPMPPAPMADPSASLRSNRHIVKTASANSIVRRSYR